MQVEASLRVGREIDTSLFPRDILLMERRGYRMEMVNVGGIIPETTLVDEEHADELQDSMEGEWGQISPLTLRARFDTETGQVVCDIIDGFHRTTGLKHIASKRQEEVFAKAVVLYGCTDDEMYDLRVLAASSVKSVKYARTVEWMRKSFESTNWEQSRIANLIQGNKITLSQIFSLAYQDTSGKIIGLTEGESLELKTWARQKANRWGKPLSTLTVELKTAELASPTLIKKVRLAGGGGQGYLTHARLQAIVTQIPHEHELQEKVADIVVQKNITAKDAAIFASAIAAAYATGNTEELLKLLEDPSIVLKVFDEDDDEESVTKTKKKGSNPNLEDHYNSTTEARDHRAMEQIRMQANLIKHQDIIINQLEKSAVKSNGTPDNSLMRVLAVRTNTSIILDIEGEKVISTSDNFEVALTPIETKILRILTSYEVPVEMYSLYVLIYDREPVESESIVELMRPHISNLRTKIGQMSPLLKDNLKNIRGVGYQWERTVS